MTDDEIEDALDSVLDQCEDLGLLSEAERDRLTDEIADGVLTCAEALTCWRDKFETATAGTAYHYAVLRFDDRNRYGTHGVPATLAAPKATSPASSDAPDVGFGGMAASKSGSGGGRTARIKRSGSGSFCASV